MKGCKEEYFLGKSKRVLGGKVSESQEKFHEKNEKANENKEKMKKLIK